MDNTQRQFEQLIRESGLVLIRYSRHSIYRAPDGRKFVCGRNGGECRLWKNRLAELRRFLRQSNEGRTDV